MEEFRNKNAWVFDLDNTLYPTDYALFSQIDKRMTSFIQDELQVIDTQSASETFVTEDVGYESCFLVLKNTNFLFHCVTSE